MHNNIINASLQLIPVATEAHPYEWVDKIIELIKKSGLNCEVGPFSTSVEGDYISVMNLINQINEYLFENKCNEWILSIQIQIRANNDVLSSEKTTKHR